MANYSYNTTAAEEAALTAVVARANTANGTSLTNGQYLLARLKDVLGDYVRQLKEEEVPTLREAYLGADAATRQQVRTLLGVN